MKKAWITAMLLALSPVAFAQHHAGKAAEKPDLGASAAVDADGTIWVVHKRGDHVVLRSSVDAGASWDEPRVVNAIAEPIEASGDSRPALAVGPEKEIYVVWARPFAKFHTGEIRFARSGDGGRSFDPPVTVHRDRREITHRFGAVAVAQGRVYVAWIDSREGPTGLYYAVSANGGRTFEEERAVASGSCECCRIALVSSPHGVLAMWRHVFGKDTRDHALVRLGAEGPGTVQRASFDNWQVDACPHHGPSLAIDGRGATHAVWFTAAPGREGVRYGRLSQGRVEGERLVGGETAAHADIAASGDSVAIAWKESAGGQSRLRALRSDDGGATWRESELAAIDGSTDQPKVLVRNGGFLVLWNTRRNPLWTISIPASATAR